MNRQKIQDSIKHAREFIVAGQSALERLDAENNERGPQPGDYSYGSPETGALRRKSMDLTRKLAELRKPS